MGISASFSGSCADSRADIRGAGEHGRIFRAKSPADYATFGELVREYVASLPFVLDFQDVENEFGRLRDEYGPPSGCALLATLEGAPAGCVGIRSTDTAAIAELKRMYVRPPARSRGLGLALGKAALEVARELGYERLRLDTVAEMVEATGIYESLGFFEIEPYRFNPLPTARFYEATLRAGGSG